jgi:hypothetical protein
MFFLSSDRFRFQNCRECRDSRWQNEKLAQMYGRNSERQCRKRKNFCKSIQPRMKAGDPGIKKYKNAPHLAPTLGATGNCVANDARGKADCGGGGG